jgi:hypothetical protein
MSEYRSTFVGINGDGNAVGDNNRITVNKREEHHHHHRRNSNGGEDSSPLAIGVVAVIAIAACCYYFSRYAREIYSVFEITGWVEAVAAVVATAFYAKRADYETAGKTIVAMTVAFFVAIVSSKASAVYPTEILELAMRAESYKAFWCGLSPYGRQVSMLHTLTACFVIAPTALLTFLSTLVLALVSIVEEGVHPSFLGFAERFSSWKIVIFVVALTLLFGYAYSDAGWQMWAESIKNPPAWPLCMK